MKNERLGCRSLCRVKKKKEEDEMENKMGEGGLPLLGRKSQGESEDYLAFVIMGGWGNLWPSTCLSGPLWRA